MSSLVLFQVQAASPVVKLGHAPPVLFTSSPICPVTHSTHSVLTSHVDTKFKINSQSFLNSCLLQPHSCNPHAGKPILNQLILLSLSLHSKRCSSAGYTPWNSWKECHLLYICPSCPHTGLMCTKCHWLHWLPQPQVRSRLEGRQYMYASAQETLDLLTAKSQKQDSQPL